MVGTQLPEATQSYLLHIAKKRNIVSSRQEYLARILFRERYLTRGSLMFRVETMMGFACFGKKSRKYSFYRDMRVVKNAFKCAGFDLRYSRNRKNPGYYFSGEGALHPDVKKEIAGALNEIDQGQNEIYKSMSPAQKFYQACSIIDMARKISTGG